MLEIDMEVEEGVARSSRKIKQDYTNALCFQCETLLMFMSILLHNKDPFLRDGYILYTLELT